MNLQISNDFSSRGVIRGEKAVKKKVGMGYYTSGILLEFESSNGENDGSLLFVAPGEEESLWLIATASRMRMERRRNRIFRPRPR